jgi:hypothetical protein
MNLKNNEITVGEVISNPQANALLKREFPDVMNPFMLQLAKKMTITEILNLAKGRYPQEKIDRVLAELQAI